MKATQALLVRKESSLRRNKVLSYVYVCSDSKSSLLPCSWSVFLFNTGAGIVVLDSQLFAVGGYDGSQHLSSVESYSSCNDQWMSIAEMKSNRCYVGTAVMGGKLYAVGGYDGFSLLDSFERYDPLLQEWTSVSSMATSRCDMGVAVLFGDWNIVFTFQHASGVNS